MGRPYHISPIVQGVLSTMAGLYETDGWHSEDYLSPAEVDLATALFDAGVRGFRQQHPIGRYTVDFWFPDAKLVVEVDGRAYHQDLEREKRRSRSILRAGAHRVLHLDARIVMAEPDECVNAIRWYVDFAAKERARRDRTIGVANQGRPSMSTTEPDETMEPDTDDDGPNTVVVVGDNATVNLTDDDDDGEPDADDSGTTP